MKRTALLLLLALATGAPGRAEVSVFDKPGLSLRHLQLLALMNASHRREDYETMEAMCRHGVKLGTADELWHYNLACALALQGQRQAALDALDRACLAGFAEEEHARLDPDLAALRASPEFDGLLARLRAAAARSRAPEPMRPDAAGTVTQSASNTVWSFELGLFQSFADLPPASAERPCAGLLYANRDTGAQPLDVARFPGLSRLACSPEMEERRLHIGLPNTLFATPDGSSLIPVLGHSSMGYLNTPYWRSQPRAVFGDPRQLALQSVFLLGNQLFFYPVYGDYDPETGDLFPANAPYGLAVVGGTHAERPFLEAALGALAALRPEARAELTRSGLLMPALQMLFRASQRTVPTWREYLTGAAHPAAFSAAHLDAARLARMAAALTTNDLPPLVTLAVLRETQTVYGRDYFDAVRTERQFDSPLAVARVFRGTARTRTLELQAHCKRPGARLRWAVLQGDPGKVTFEPCPTNPALMTLTVAYHEPFAAPAGGGRTIPTARVDVGVFAETAAGFSAPAFVSFYSLGNERRVYGADGRIESVDYTRRTSAYVDPLLSYTRNWKDEYRYDAQGRCSGWTRRRGLAEEAFTAYGHKVVATDARGRALKAHVVRYAPRSVKRGEEVAGTPDLAQVDDNIEIRYSYESDDDAVGRPDLSTLKRETEPPASDP